MCAGDAAAADVQARVGDFGEASSGGSAQPAAWQRQPAPFGAAGWQFQNAQFQQRQHGSAAQQDPLHISQHNESQS